MATEKRERQKQNRQVKQAVEAKEKAKTQRINGIRNLLILIAVFVGLVFLGYLYFRGDDETTATTDDVDVSIEETEPVVSDDLTPCPATDGTQEQQRSFTAAQEFCLEDGVTYSAEVTTNFGEFTIELDQERAPETVNNFVSLARYKYYDGLTFHRIVDDFVIQGGDPLGNGSGGPGYSFADELPDSVDDYKLGTVAMANSGPDTNGSQFFVVTSDNPWPEPLYSIFGEVVSGLDVVETIDNLEVEASAPVEDAIIETVVITEG